MYSEKNTVNARVLVFPSVHWIVSVSVQICWINFVGLKSKRWVMCNTFLRYLSVCWLGANYFSTVCQQDWCLLEINVNINALALALELKGTWWKRERFYWERNIMWGIRKNCGKIILFYLLQFLIHIYTLIRHDHFSQKMEQHASMHQLGAVSKPIKFLFIILILQREKILFNFRFMRNGIFSRKLKWI